MIKYIIGLAVPTILFLCVFFSYGFIQDLNKPKKPNSLDIAIRKLDCSLLILDAVSRHDLRFTGKTREEVRKQIDSFQNDCVKYTLLNGEINERR